jgi:hypothetical protein
VSRRQETDRRRRAALRCPRPPAGASADVGPRAPKVPLRWSAREPAIGVRGNEPGSYCLTMVPPGIEPSLVDEFVRQLYLVVHEQGALWEPLTASTVVLADRTQTHGPWPPEACSWTFTRWLDAGFIGVFRSNPPEGDTADLSPEEARAAPQHTLRHAEVLQAVRGRW